MRTHWCYDFNAVIMMLLYNDVFVYDKYSRVLLQNNLNASKVSFNFRLTLMNLTRIQMRADHIMEITS